MNIVVFSPADTFAPDSLPALTADDTVHVVRWDAPGHAADGRIGVPQNATAARIVAAASGSVLTRTIIRALPLDTGARFWRATRAQQAVKDAVRHADLIVAPERDGAYAAWSWRRFASRKGREIPAVSGYPAARVAIEQRR